MLLPGVYFSSSLNATNWSIELINTLSKSSYSLLTSWSY